MDNVHETPPPSGEQPYGYYPPPPARAQQQTPARHAAALWIGAGLSAGLGILLRVIPVYQGANIPQWNKICTSGIGELGQALSSSIRMHCGWAADLNDLSWLMLVVGGLLLAVGLRAAVFKPARSLRGCVVTRSV